MLSKLVLKDWNIFCVCASRQFDRNLKFYSMYNLKETIILYGNHKNIANVKFNREKKQDTENT